MKTEICRKGEPIKCAPCPKGGWIGERVSKEDGVVFRLNNEEQNRGGMFISDKKFNEMGFIRKDNIRLIDLIKMDLIYICTNLELNIKGRKSELIDRILGE